MSGNELFPIFLFQNHIFIIVICAKVRGDAL